MWSWTVIRIKNSVVGLSGYFLNHGKLTALLIFYFRDQKEGKEQLTGWEGQAAPRPALTALVWGLGSSEQTQEPPVERGHQGSVAQTSIRRQSGVAESRDLSFSAA